MCVFLGRQTHRHLLGTADPSAALKGDEVSSRHKRRRNISGKTNSTCKSTNVELENARSLVWLVKSESEGFLRTCAEMKKLGFCSS